MRLHNWLIAILAVSLLAPSAPAPASPQKPSTAQTQLYWGDTHLHTNYTPDAYSLLTTTADPDTSYRFAKGMPVIADLSRSRVQIETPLDFLVVTDHAEYMGVIPELANGNEVLLNTKLGPQWKKMLDEGKGSALFMELARDKRQTLTWRYPIAVSSTFGLLHGFGFAAVLTDIGLPQTEIPAALLFFNVGVEIGQIIFVITALVLFFIGKRIVATLREMTFHEVLMRIQRPAGYVVGTLAMLWTIERVSLFWA